MALGHHRLARGVCRPVGQPLGRLLPIMAVATIAARFNARPKPAVPSWRKIMPDASTDGKPAASETSWPWSFSRPCCCSPLAGNSGSTKRRVSPVVSTKSRSGAKPARRKATAESPGNFPHGFPLKPLCFAV